MITHYGFKATGKMVYKNSATFVNNDLTPSVSGGNLFLCATGHSAARSLTNFDDGLEGQIIIIKGANPTYKTTLVDGTYLKLNGNWVEATNNMIMLIRIGSYWYELCRSANA